MNIDEIKKIVDNILEDGPVSSILAFSSATSMSNSPANTGGASTPKAVGGTTDSNKKVVNDENTTNTNTSGLQKLAATQVPGLNNKISKSTNTPNKNTKSKFTVYKG